MDPGNLARSKERKTQGKCNGQPMRDVIAKGDYGVGVGAGIVTETGSGKGL